MITVDLNRLDLKRGYRVLDIGCGSGRHMAALHDIENITVVGSDLCFDKLQFARSRMELHDQFAGKDRGVWKLASADIMRLPFSDDYFDLIICSEVLEHIHDDKGALDELVRVLKPGKILVVSVPRYLPEKLCWILSDDYSDNNHVRIYRKKSLIKLLELSGLFCFYTHYAHSLHTPFWLLKCMIGPAVTDSILVNLYHRFLVWDMTAQPYITNLVSKLLNPIFGKSIVIYTTKKAD